MGGLSDIGIKVICFLWGKWGGNFGVEYVRRLKHGVDRHLSLPHRFVCLSDRKVGGIETIPLGLEWAKWNLRKIYAYKPGLFKGRVLMLDLDVVIVGSIDDIASYAGKFATCEGAYRKRKIGGSIISFEAGFGKKMLWQPLENEYRAIERDTGGSERYYFQRQFGQHGFVPDFWQDLYPGQIASYKRDCREGIPKGARIVRFHGRPRPHEVKDEWVKEHWR